LPAWEAVNVQSPVPLPTVTVLLASVHAPEAVIVTGSPELAVADTVKLAP
jgi:hypothetical protein